MACFLLACLLKVFGLALRRVCLFVCCLFLFRSVDRLALIASSLLNLNDRRNLVAIRSRLSGATIQPFLLASSSRSLEESYHGTICSVQTVTTIN